MVETKGNEGKGEIDYPVALTKSVERGRYLIASRFIPKGSIALKESFLSYIVYGPKIQRVCDSCLVYSHPGPLNIHCNKCNLVYYCSEKCEEKDKEAHHAECDAFCKMDSDLFTNKYYFEAIKLIVRIVTRKQHLSPKRSSDDIELNYNKFHLDTLFGHNAFLAENEAPKAIQHAKEVLSLDEAGEEELKKYYCIEETNSFAIRGKGLCGVGLLYFSSFMNHSCVPNLVRREVGTTYEFVATKDIQAGADLSISYMDITLGYDERQQYLSKAFCFNCDCERCVFEAEHKKAMELGDYLSATVCRESSCSQFGKPLSLPSSHLSIPLSHHCTSCGWERLLPHIWVKHENPSLLLNNNINN